jgi:hypothetical protein
VDKAFFQRFVEAVEEEIVRINNSAHPSVIWYKNLLDFLTIKVVEHE